MLIKWVHACQAWAVLEAADGNTHLARQLFRCAVKADPSSEPSWLVRSLLHLGHGREIAMRERTASIAEACTEPRPAVAALVRTDSSSIDSGNNILPDILKALHSGRSSIDFFALATL